MRRFFFIFCLLLTAGSAHAQKPVTVYFPLILKDSCMPTCNEVWKFITPVYSKNTVHNPSAEGAGDYAALGGATVNLSTAQSFFGLYSYAVSTFANGDGLELDTDALTNDAHFVSIHVYGVWPDNWRVLVRTQYRTPVLLETFDENWRLYGLRIPAEDANGATSVSIIQQGEGGETVYVDAIQVEQLDYPTTFIDGDQEGCAWLGAEHASASERSASSRAGGRMRDFYKDFGFVVEKSEGTGTPAPKLQLDSYALLPGGRVSAAQHQSRTFTLVGTLVADSEQELYERREALAQALDPVAYEAQPVIVRFAGEEVQKQVYCHYEGGLEGDIPVYGGPYRRETRSNQWEEVQYFMEAIPLRFLCGSPYWEEVGESSQLLDVNESFTAKIVTARFRDAGQWDDLGPPAAGGSYNEVYAFAEDGTYVYVGGDFTNFDNDGNADYIVRYNKQTGEWSPMGTGMDDVVQALLIAPDGDLYAAGEFTVPGAYVARWDPDAEAWNALGAGANANSYALAVDSSGLIYLGGAFVAAGGGAASRIAVWNPDTATWSALGAGLDATCWAIVIKADDTLIAGGDFNNAGGAAANYTASWDGTNWSAFSDELDNSVYALALTRGEDLYAGGAFTDHVSIWNGTFWSTLDDGVNGDVWDLFIAPDDTLFIAGAFSSAGGLTLNDRLTRWNGSSFAHLDLNLPGAVTTYAVMTSRADPANPSRYDIWLGFDTDAGTTYYDGVAAATNDGTAPAYPKIIFTRNGGTAATIETVRNETTGQELLFNYELRDGETLEIDLTPTSKSIISSHGFFPQRFKPGALLTGSDFGAWHLEPGDNLVSSYVDFDVALYSSEVVAWLQWKDQYLSLD